MLLISAIGNSLKSQLILKSKTVFDEFEELDLD
jgi:hypothetical protein